MRVKHLIVASLTLALGACGEQASEQAEEQAAEETAPPPQTPEERFADVVVTAEALRGGVHVLFGAGGNIGVSAGEDGVFIIDDQFAPLTDRILAAVATISDQPIRFLINTHFHGDHTGGNENLGAMGAIIMAQDNVRIRMSSEQFRANLDNAVAASPGGALPVITFSDQASLRLNGDEARIIYVANAHTDGDSLILFREANVIHMGDTYFNGRYPFIDVDMGGSIDGLIAAIEHALTIIDDDTIVIPGHGALSNRSEMTAYLAMLQAVRERVATVVDEGMSLEEAQVARPLADIDDVWGDDASRDRMVMLTYWSLTGE